MEITEVSTGKVKKVKVLVLDRKDIKKIPKSRYSFDWKKVDAAATIFILCEEGGQDILGAMAILKFPEEVRNEIKLLAVSRENVGKNKLYEGIAGCLIGFACRECLNEYDELAAVSLVPKTKLKPHYMRKYGMQDAGYQIFLSDISLMKIINKYYL